MSSPAEVPLLGDARLWRAERALEAINKGVKNRHSTLRIVRRAKRVMQEDPPIVLARL